MNGGHGEEVIRAVYCPPASNLIYTGGEDGNLRIWKSDIQLNAPESFFDSASTDQNELKEDIEMGDVEDDSESTSGEAKEKKSKKEKGEKKDKKDKKEKKEKKEKKDKKDKKHKHKEEKKSKKEHRFRPY